MYAKNTRNNTTTKGLIIIQKMTIASQNMRAVWASLTQTIDWFYF